MSKEIKAVIIDDMDAARAVLKADLKEHCSIVNIVGEANSVVNGLKLLKNTKVDLVFLDIELDDGLGFDILELLGHYTFKVIFTTAQDNYAIKAFQVAAVDYLLKPIDPDLLIKAVEKIDKTHVHTAEQIDILNKSISNIAKPNKIVLHTQEKIISADIDDIVRCESMGNYTTFYFKDKSKLLITRTLKEFDKILGPYNFIRTHQSHLINSNYVKEFVKTEGGYLLLTDGSRVSVSVRKRSEVLSELGMN